MIRCGQKKAQANAPSVTILKLLVALVAISNPFSEAWADVKAGAERAAAYNDLQPSSASRSDGAVMIIRFNQKNVYFQNSLKKVVDRVSEVKPEAVYEIQSVIPSVAVNGRGNDREYAMNLHRVISEFNTLGVPMGRINIDISDSPDVREHEIRILIR